MRKLKISEFNKKLKTFTLLLVCLFSFSLPLKAEAFSFSDLSLKVYCIISPIFNSDNSKCENNINASSKTNLVKSTVTSTITSNESVKEALIKTDLDNITTNNILSTTKDKILNNVNPVAENTLNNPIVKKGDNINLNNQKVTIIRQIVNVPVPGPQGPKGDRGDTGAAGANGFVNNSVIPTSLIAPGAVTGWLGSNYVVNSPFVVPSINTDYIKSTSSIIKI